MRAQRPERNGADKPVVALDIDGTLGDYHGHFLRFAEAWLGKDMPDPADINPGMPLHKFMHVTKARYRECKLAYRQGGMKRSMPVYPGAAELTKAMRRVGAEVWICTTRPFNRLDNIDPDTREWLRRNKIQYDYVLYGEDKYTELVHQVDPDRIVGAVDDLPEMIAAARKAGIASLYLRDQPYNQHVSPPWSGLTRVTNMYQLRGMLEIDIEIWRSEYGARG